MSAHVRLAAFALQARLALARRGGLGPIAVLLLAAAAAAWGLALPQLRAQAAQERARLDAAQRHAREPRTASDTPPPLARQRLRDFRAVLGDVRRADESLQAVFAAGERARLVLDQAEYKLAYDRAGRFWTYAVQLPVSGSYAAIRGFGEQVLLALPYAALDEIDFRRKDIAQPTLEARLHFTLHLDGPPEGAAR